MDDGKYFAFLGQAIYRGKYNLQNIPSQLFKMMFISMNRRQYILYLIRVTGKAGNARNVYRESVNDQQGRKRDRHYHYFAVQCCSANSKHSATSTGDVNSPYDLCLRPREYNLSVITPCSNSTQRRHELLMKHGNGGDEGNKKNWKDTRRK